MHVNAGSPIATSIIRSESCNASIDHHMAKIHIGHSGKLYAVPAGRSSHPSPLYKVHATAAALAPDTQRELLVRVLVMNISNSSTTISNPTVSDLSDLMNIK